MFANFRVFTRSMITEASNEVKFGFANIVLTTTAHYICETNREGGNTIMHTL